VEEVAVDFGLSVVKPANTGAVQFRGHRAISREEWTSIYPESYNCPC